MPGFTLGGVRSSSRFGQVLHQMYLLSMAFLKEGKAPSRWALWIVVDNKLEPSDPSVMGPHNINAVQSRISTHTCQSILSAPSAPI